MSAKLDIFFETSKELGKKHTKFMAWACCYSMSHDYQFYVAKLRISEQNTKYI